MAKRLKIYVAHPICGVTGSPEEIAWNIQHAANLNRWLESTFPNVDWHVPGAHDAFAQEAWNKELDTKTILAIDKRILACCDGCVVMMWSASNGADEEMVFALEQNIPIFLIRNYWPDANDVSRFLNELMVKGV